MKTRILEVDILKGFAMICMIIGHSIIVFPVDISHVPWCESLHNFIYSFHMELLFLLSGFLYKKKDNASYYKGKAQRILIPYLIWGAIFVLMPVIFASVVHRDTSLSDGIKNYFFYGGGYWFLYTLLFVFLIYPVIDKLGYWIKVGLVLLLIITNYYIEYPPLFCIDQIMYYLPFFMIGNLLAEYNKKRDKQTTRFAGVFGLIFVMTLFINRIISVPEYYSNLINTVCIMGLLSVAVYYIYNVFVTTGDVALDKVISFTSLCGKYSLQLYLFNGFLLVPLRIVLCSLCKITDPIIIVSVISTVDIVLSLLACFYILPKSRILSLICGVKQEVK